MNLEEVRKNIDLVDSKILKLISNRMELALMSKKFKAEIKDPKREKELLNRIRESSDTLIDAPFCEKLFLEIIKESKKLQEKDYHLIGFQGEHGAYSEVASKEWDKKLVPIPCKEFAEVFEGVDNGWYDYGIVPLDNTLGGIVGPVNKLLINTELYVIGAVDLPIRHCLLAPQGADHRDIKIVYSHFQALAQCRNFVARNKLEPMPYYDTAGAARWLAEEMPKASAVIASKLAAELYNLEIIKENIEDNKANYTRFLVLSKKVNKQEGNKCSVIFGTEHKAGILFKVLECFAKENVNLTKIESVTNEPGNYAFFLDFAGSNKDEKVMKVLEQVEKMTAGFRLMGCYNERKIEI